MADLTWPGVFITLFVGMGPVKSLVVFIEVTKDMEPALRRSMARRVVLVAGGVGLVLLLFGSVFQAILHFSIGALSIAGGLILLVLALRMVIGSQGPSPDEHAHRDPMSIAISPLGVPLTLNPVGIVALVTFSAEGENAADLGIIAGMIFGIMLIDLAVLSLSARLATYMSHQVIELTERVLGILLAALAVQLVLDGLDDLGIISLLPH
jgi:multiple antibiotic resistance protein